MSTKTSFKRIALVAVAALGMGVLTSVSPASAANTAVHCLTADGLSSGTTANVTCTGVAGAANTVTLKTLAAGVTANDRLTVSGAGATFGTVTGAGNVIATNGLTATLADIDGTITVLTPTVGTVTVSLFQLLSPGIYSATAFESVTVTVNATANSGTATVSTSAAVILANGATLTSYDDYTEISGATNSTTAVDGRVSGVASAVIAGIIRDAVPAAVTGATVSMSVSGPGTISASVDGATTQTLADGGKADSIVTVSGGLFYGRLYSDGTSGVATVTIKVGTTVFATKSVTFYGTPTSISATQNLYNVAAAGTLGKATAAGAATGADVANTYAATITVKDALGNPALGTVSALSSDTTVIDTAACTASSVTTGIYNCEVHGASGATVGKTATVTWQVLLADGVTKASATPLTFKIGGTAAKATVAPAAAAYTPGSLVTLNVTVTDALGNAAADLDTNVFAAGIKSSVALTKDWSLAGAGEANIAVVNGKASLTFYAPLTTGPVVIDLPVETAFSLSSTITKLSTTVTVSESASVAALTTLINSLIKKINALATLVAKIQKKLGVK